MTATRKELEAQVRLLSRAVHLLIRHSKAGDRWAKDLTEDEQEELRIIDIDLKFGWGYRSRQQKGEVPEQQGTVDE